MLREYIPSIAAAVTLLFVMTLLPGPVTPGDYYAASLPQSGQKCVDPVDGLTNWWDGDNVSGTTAEDIKGASDGTMSDVTLVPGKVGNAFSFKGNDFINNARQDRTGSFVRFPQNFFPYPTTQRGNNPFTIELWFKTTADGVIFGQQTAKPWDGHNGWVPGIAVGTDGDLMVETFWNGTRVIYSNRSVKDGQWHHMAAVYNGTDNKMFIDGANVGNISMDQDPYSQIYNYQLGTGATAGRKGGVGGWHSFKGEIDEVSIYDKALSTDEVGAIFQAGEFGKCKLECGNNFIQAGEVCDGLDLAGETCESQQGAGFNGPLTCKSDCTGYDISQCAAPALCKDGVDNDLDGLIDHPSDPGCTSPDDGDETDPPPPPINRNVTFSTDIRPQIVTQPALQEREILVFQAPCSTCTVTTSPDHTQFVGGSAAADAGFVITAKSIDSSTNSTSYTIVVVQPKNNKEYQTHTQIFRGDGKEYTNLQR
jgi:hypothetical protein